VAEQEIRRYIRLSPTVLFRVPECYGMFGSSDGKRSCDTCFHARRCELGEETIDVPYPDVTENRCSACGKPDMKKESGYWQCSCGHRFYGEFDTNPLIDCQNCNATYSINARVCPNCGLGERSGP